MLSDQAFGDQVKTVQFDFNSNIARFSLLKTLKNNAHLIHLNEIELVYWHMINVKMLEMGLWSKFKFDTASDHQELGEILIMTGLLSKKLCNSYEEYEIFQEFVFHNLQLAVYQRDEPAANKRVAKQVAKENEKKKTIREKFHEFEN